MNNLYPKSVKELQSRIDWISSVTPFMSTEFNAYAKERDELQIKLDRLKNVEPGYYWAIENDYPDEEPICILIGPQLSVVEHGSECRRSLNEFDLVERIEVPRPGKNPAPNSINYYHQKEN